MNLKEVLRRVAEIADRTDDDEWAHGLEDDLYLDLLCAIAAGTAEDPAQCAAEAIKTQGLDFARWCA